MVIIVPAGRKYTSRIRGLVSRRVVCESCGCNYQYSFGISASGKGSSPMYTDNEGAAMKARSEAIAQFEKLAVHKSAPVPCPRCLHIQAEMIKRIWLHQVVPMFVFAAIALGLGVLGYFSERETLGRIRFAELAPYIVPGLAIFAVGLLLYMFRIKWDSPERKQRAIRKYQVKEVEGAGEGIQH